MVIYQQVENHVLQQLVYNRTVKLSPLAIALSVAAGAEIGGIVGALLSIPVAGRSRSPRASCSPGGEAPSVGDAHAESNTIPPAVVN